MTDRTDAFLAQLDTFRGLNFTGETKLLWKHGRVLAMGFTQEIRPTDSDTVRSAVLVQPSSVRHSA